MELRQQLLLTDALHRVRMQAILLQENAHDSRRPDREAIKVSRYYGKLPAMVAYL